MPETGRVCSYRNTSVVRLVSADDAEQTSTDTRPSHITRFMKVRINCLIGICFLQRLHVLSAARVRENWFLVSPSIVEPYQMPFAPSTANIVIFWSAEGWFW